MPNMGMMQMGVGGGAPDAEPDAYTYTDQTGKDPSAIITSNAITVLDINITVQITITGGTYKINDGSYVSTEGTVTKDDTVTVRVTSSGSFNTAVSATTTIGGIQDTFSVTTRGPVQSTIAKGTGAAFSNSVQDSPYNPAFNNPANAFNNNKTYVPGTGGIIWIHPFYNLYVGKDWGAGQTKWVDSFIVHSPIPVNWSGNNVYTINMWFYGSNSAPSAYNNGTVIATIGTIPNAAGTYYTQSRSGLAQHAYRYHWISITSSGPECIIAEIDWTEKS